MSRIDQTDTDANRGVVGAEAGVVAHTPGPWEVQRLNHYRNALWLQVGYAGRGPIARTATSVEPMLGAVAEFKYLVTDEAEQWANAHLMAAAPDLLAACVLAEQFIRNGVELGFIRMPDADTADSAHDSLPAIEAAIAKAKPAPSSPVIVGINVPNAGKRGQARTLLAAMAEADAHDVHTPNSALNQPTIEPYGKP